MKLRTNKVNKYIQTIKYHKWNDIYFGDLETITFESNYYQKYQKTRPHFGYLLNAKTNVGFLFRDFEELFTKLENNYKKRTLYIYFHNLYFDGTFLLDFLNNNKKYQIVNKINFKEKKNQVSFFRKDNKIYRIKIFYAPHHNVIEFRCSYQLLNMSIKSLGEIVNLPKLETNYNVEYEQDINNYPKEFIEYCKRDVEILCKGFKQFYYLFLDKYHIDMLEAFTSGQMSYNALMSDILSSHNWNVDNEESFNAMNEFIKLENETWDLGHKFYYGGFNQYRNLPYKQNKIICPNGIKIDINSSYPYAMTLNLPYGPLHNLKDTKPNGMHIKFHIIKIKHAKSKFKEINTLRNWHNIDTIEFDSIEDYFNAEIPDEYVNEISNCLAYYMDLELFLMKKYNDMDYEIVDTYWFNAKPYASSWIENMYETKSNPTTPKALKQLTKLLMNSAYGKFGQNPLNTEYYICNNEEEYKNLIKEKDITDEQGITWHYYIPATNDLTNYYVLKRRQMTHHPTKLLRHIWVAATITSYARINLLGTLLNLGVENFIYCDTDSLILANYDYKINRFLDEYELGKWKDESKVHKGIKEVWILGKKCYSCFYNDNTYDRRFAGINEEVLNNFTNNELDEIFSYQKTHIDNAVHKMERVKGGLVLKTSDYIIKKRGH